VARPAIFFAGASLPWPGVLAALGGAVSAACAYVTVRRLRRTDHPDVIVFYFPLVAVPAVLPFALSVWVWPSPLEWALLLVLGVVVQTAQVLLTRGLALIPAGQGTAVGYVQIAFAAAWGWLLFGEVPSVAAALGAGAIFAAALLSSRR
jgi:drug/metabolite transporter (DMT)-like permease